MVYLLLTGFATLGAENSTQMISLKKYLDSDDADLPKIVRQDPLEVLPSVIMAYRSALVEMGSCSTDACPALGNGLKVELGRLEAALADVVDCGQVEKTQRNVQNQLQDWGRRTAAHYRQTTSEVKELLLVMARSAEAVGERDKRSADQLNSVTTRLERIVSLEDLTEIRASVERSARELKSSLDRMAAEGKAAVEQLRAEVSLYQAKLEIAEEAASRDALTGLRNRSWMESQIERRLARNGPFTLAIIDIDGFKAVNDKHGHLAGDELLRMFAGELRSASRSTDLIGRWGGDEFILALDGGIEDGRTQVDRLSAWACGLYKIAGRTAPIEVKVGASIGLAERAPNEPMAVLLARADAEMYKHKEASRNGRMRA
jgi:diguanylate cyclase (GGDEF)-like protein